MIFVGSSFADELYRKRYPFRGFPALLPHKVVAVGVEARQADVSVGHGYLHSHIKVQTVPLQGQFQLVVLSSAVVAAGTYIIGIGLFATRELQMTEKIVDHER